MQEKLSILLIDDEEIVRIYTKVLFEQNGYKVHVCSNGAAAIMFYRQHKNEIDLVLLDMIMPDMGGAETFAQLQKINPAVKVILASGSGRDKDIQNLLDNGVLDFVQKPFTLEQLSNVITRVLK